MGYEFNRTLGSNTLEEGKLEIRPLVTSHTLSKNWKELKAFFSLFGDFLQNHHENITYIYIYTCTCMYVYDLMAFTIGYL